MNYLFSKKKKTNGVRLDSPLNLTVSIIIIGHLKFEKYDHYRFINGIGRGCFTHCVIQLLYSVLYLVDSQVGEVSTGNSNTSNASNTNTKKPFAYGPYAGT